MESVSQRSKNVETNPFPQGKHNKQTRGSLSRNKVKERRDVKGEWNFTEAMGRKVRIWNGNNNSIKMTIFVSRTGARPGVRGTCEVIVIVMESEYN